MEDKGFKNDIDGKESVKRKVGLRLVNLAISMAIIDYLLRVVFMMLERELKYDFPHEVFWSLLGSGMAAIGLTLVERFGKK